MKKPIFDQDAIDRHRADEDRLDEAKEQPVEQADARPCPVPVKPGAANAAAAYRAGCEDEWIDRMNARYGGEW